MEVSDELSERRRIGLQLDVGLQVFSRRESAIASAHEHGAHAAIVLCGGEPPLELPHQISAQRIEGFGAVQHRRAASTPSAANLDQVAFREAAKTSRAAVLRAVDIRDLKPHARPPSAGTF
jgi:hypothetical protein